jgi:multidrug efflux pump
MSLDKEIKQLNEKVIREFKLTSLSLKNRTSVFLLTFIIIIFGIYSYRSMPKELFPDIALPWIMVQTIYPGNPPIDMENLVTRPIEKEIEPIKGIKNITSTSTQDISFILVEFNPGEDIKTAEDEVKNAVDYAKSDLPNDLPSDPIVTDIDFSEFPIININLSGDYSTSELKKYAETLEERIETISEISKVEITGISDREVQINIDLLKLEAMQLSFDDIANAIMFENMSISGGELKMEGTRRSIRTVGEFENIDQIKNIIVKRDQGNIVYLRDLAEVVDTYEDPTSYTRLNGQPVVSLQVVKKGGENLLSAARKINNILADIENDNIFPDDLHITVTNDQSEIVEYQLNSLQNSMLMSMIFVITVLFLFLGTRNALFVGLAIPLSMFLSFFVLELINFQVNMIVLFSLILALGMLVDNAIVVVENIYRFLHQGYSKYQAAKQAVGEIAVPIIASTATTLAAFLPLAFWKGIVGEFMKYLPITLIIVLTSSLFVALVIIPVFSSAFIKKDEHKDTVNRKLAFRIVLVLAALAAISYPLKIYMVANLSVIAIGITLLNLFVFNALGRWFKDVFLSRLETIYQKVLNFALRRYNPVWFLSGTFLLLILTIVFFIARSPNVLFFSDNDPDYINILAELPVGSDIEQTNRFSQRFERDIDRIVAPYNSIIRSKLLNVGEGAVLENDMDWIANRDNKCLMTISFVDFQYRQGINTGKIMKELNDSLSNRYAGVDISFEKNSMGPPTGKAINIEVSGKDYEKLISVADTLMQMIENAKIEGIESLQMDLDLGMPEMLVTINRDKARRLEMSTAQIAGTIRTALFGREISDLKIGEEEYPIQLRSMAKYKNNVSALMNQKIVFMNNQGKWLSIPISAVADFNYSSTYGAVKRKDLDRVITLYSNVVPGYNANNINNQIKSLLAGYDMPPGYEYKFTGEQEDMNESMEFLGRAFIIAIALMMLILVTQFNSIVRPFIIIASVVFSTIGVLGGIATFKMDFIITMTGIGIVSLAGVVVNNAIVLIDYIELLKLRKRRELGLEDNAFLPVINATECIVQGGKTRLRPVLLTAITTILGLIPMAIGLNIDFASLLRTFNPKLYIGGSMTGIWGPISWTVIFGLSFATFLTLIIVPVMYRITTVLQKKAYALSTAKGKRERLVE